MGIYESSLGVSQTFFELLSIFSKLLKLVEGTHKWSNLRGCFLAVYRACCEEMTIWCAYLTPRIEARLHNAAAYVCRNHDLHWPSLKVKHLTIFLGSIRSYQS